MSKTSDAVFDQKFDQNWSFLGPKPKKDEGLVLFWQKWVNLTLVKIGLCAQSGRGVGFEPKNDHFWQILPKMVIFESSILAFQKTPQVSLFFGGFDFGQKIGQKRPFFGLYVRSFRHVFYPLPPHTVFWAQIFGGYTSSFESRSERAQILETLACGVPKVDQNWLIK